MAMYERPAGKIIEFFKDVATRRPTGRRAAFARSGDGERHLTGRGNLAAAGVTAGLAAFHVAEHHARDFIDNPWIAERRRVRSFTPIDWRFPFRSAKPLRCGRKAGTRRSHCERRPARCLRPELLGLRGPAVCRHRRPDPRQRFLAIARPQPDAAPRCARLRSGGGAARWHRRLKNGVGSACRNSRSSRPWTKIAAAWSATPGCRTADITARMI